MEAMCVYKFTLDTGFYYIGGTTNLGERISDHLKFYRNGTQSKAITKALDEARVITFEFLRFVNNKKDLGKWEQSYLERNVGLHLCLNTQSKIITTYIKKEALYKIARLTNGVIDKIYNYSTEAAIDNGISVRTLRINYNAQYPIGKVIYRKIDKNGDIIKPIKIKPSNRPGEKKIRQYDKDLNFIQQYVSMSEAARSIGITRREVGKVANGVQRIAKGFIFRMVAENGDDIIPILKQKNRSNKTA